MKAVKFSLAMLAVCIASFAGCSLKPPFTLIGTIPIPIMAIKPDSHYMVLEREQCTASGRQLYLQKIKEDLNIVYIHKTPAGTDFEEKLELLIASGDIPDVITSYGALTAKLVKWELPGLSKIPHT